MRPRRSPTSTAPLSSASSTANTAAASKRRGRPPKVSRQQLSPSSAEDQGESAASASATDDSTGREPSSIPQHLLPSLPIGESTGAPLLESGEDLSSTHEPAASSMLEGPGMPGPSLDDDIVSSNTAVSHAIQPANRRYNTRPTNEAHPAKKFGLEKRTMDDIIAEADRKRAEKDAIIQQQQEQIAALQAKYERGMAGLGELEDRLETMRRNSRVPCGAPSQAGNFLLEADEEDIPMEDVIEDAPVPPKKRSQKAVSLIVSLLLQLIDLINRKVNKL